MLSRIGLLEHLRVFVRTIQLLELEDIGMLLYEVSLHLTAHERVVLRHGRLVLLIHVGEGAKILGAFDLLEKAMLVLCILSQLSVATVLHLLDEINLL